MAYPHDTPTMESAGRYHAGVAHHRVPTNREVVAVNLFSPTSLKGWVEKHRHLLKPPVGNKCIWANEDFIIMVVGGPNTRKDYHVNETSEFFYQIEGDIIVRIINPNTKKPEDVILREGDIYLLPPLVPHSPQRSAGTVGLVIVYGLTEHMIDKLQWYYDDTHELVFEAELKLKHIDEDLKRSMGEFWSNENH